MVWFSDDPELKAIQDELTMAPFEAVGMVRKIGTIGTEILYERTDVTDIDNEDFMRRSRQLEKEMIHRCFERSCGRPMLGAEDFHEWARSFDGERYLRAIYFDDEWMLNP